MPQRYKPIYVQEAAKTRKHHYLLPSYLVGKVGGYLTYCRFLGTEVLVLSSHLHWVVVRCKGSWYLRWVPGLTTYPKLFMGGRMYSVPTCLYLR